MKIIFAILCLIAVSAAPAAEIIDIRDVLIENAKSQWSHFPDGQHTVLTKFAYIGKVETQEGRIYVIDSQQVINDMKEPRGRHDILFFDKHESFIDSLPVDSGWYPEPLRCQDGLLFFSGRSKGLPTNTAGVSYNGNALDLRFGWKDRMMVDCAAAGSALEKDLPSREQRERERANWDSK